MEHNGERMISPRYSREDFLEIHLNIHSDEYQWRRAIDIFDDRIRGRYLDPIYQLSNDLKSNGFAIMALNCLLVETFYQFEQGIDETEYKQNCKKYVDFLQRMMPNIFPSNNSRKLFYNHIRCGILHSAQTKKGSQLTYGKNYVVKVLPDKKIRVDVENFSHELMTYYDYYKKRL